MRLGGSTQCVDVWSNRPTVQVVSGNYRKRVVFEKTVLISLIIILGYPDRQSLQLISLCERNIGTRLAKQVERLFGYFRLKIDVKRIETSD